MVWYLELCPEVYRATSESKYQESSIGFENLAHLQSIESKCNIRAPSRRSSLVSFGSYTGGGGGGEGGGTTVREDDGVATLFRSYFYNYCPI